MNSMSVSLKLYVVRYRCIAKTTEKETGRMHSLMTDVLMAQDFQDLTGQVIRKVIDLVHEVEESLINMLTAFGISSEEGKENHSTFSR